MAAMNQNDSDSDYCLVFCKKKKEFTDFPHLEAEAERVVAAGVTEAGQPTQDLPHVHRAVAVVVEEVKHAWRQRDQRLQLHRLQHLLELCQRRVLAVGASACTSRSTTVSLLFTALSISYHIRCPFFQ